MKSNNSILALCAIVLLCAVSCTKDNAVSADLVDEQLVAEAKVIPLEDALKTLDSFVAEFESDNLITKSAASRKIASVETHYSDILTKSGEELPDAYIVNYENEEGFAVLGANTDVVPVVAYTEDGSFSNEDLESYFSQSGKKVTDIEFDEEGYPMVASECPSIVAGAIGSSISNTDNPCTVSTTTKASATYVAPLVQTRWRQGQWSRYNYTCYNKYCRYNRYYAWTGCITVAIAQVMACNKYSDPTFKYYNMVTYGRLADYEYSDSYRVDITSQFIGAIFTSTVSYANADGTASSISAARNYLRQMDGYYNVRCSQQNAFTNALVTTAMGMIREGKPVIVSAAGENLSDKHAWILDGYKYINGNLYFHCNWGYGGAFDGYFSANWFSFTAGNAQYDDLDSTNRALTQYNYDDISSNYCWWVGMVTYDHR